jgi:hypothetical protein
VLTADLLDAAVFELIETAGAGLPAAENRAVFVAIEVDADLVAFLKWQACSN